MRLGEHLLEDLPLFGERLDAILRFGACLEQYPASIVYLDKQVHQFLVWVIANVQLAYVNDVAETVLH